MVPAGLRNHVQLHCYHRGAASHFALSYRISVTYPIGSTTPTWGQRNTPIPASTCKHSYTVTKRLRTALAAEASVWNIPSQVHILDDESTVAANRRRRQIYSSAKSNCLFALIQPRLLSSVCLPGGTLRLARGSLQQNRRSQSGKLPRCMFHHRENDGQPSCSPRDGTS